MAPPNMIRHNPTIPDIMTNAVPHPTPHIAPLAGTFLQSSNEVEVVVVVPVVVGVVDYKSRVD